MSDKANFSTLQVQGPKKKASLKPSQEASAMSADDNAAAKKLAKEKRSKERKFRKNNPTKLRVKLPPIESYDKELEYIPDVPGRVLIRLERLMGTDRVRITDTKYLKALLAALEKEEQMIWAKRAKSRKKDERNRSRKLAIDGHMEPGDDMQDLYKHPVFRVNRILNRLSQLDSRTTMAPSKKLPPITPVEPFEEYERTGILFEFHPNHYLKDKTVYEDVSSAPPSSAASAEEQTPQDLEEFYAKLEAAKAAADEESAARAGFVAPPTGTTSTASRRRRELLGEWGGEDGEEDEDEDGAAPVEIEVSKLIQIEDTTDEEEDEDEEEEMDEGCQVELMARGSMTTAKAHFGIPTQEDLQTKWAPYKSHLVEQVYDDETAGIATEMYEFAQAVLSTYKRENLVAEDFVNKELKQFI